MNQNKLRFIITIFGQKHLGFLFCNLFSLLKSNSNASVSVFYEDVEEKYLNIIRQVFPDVELIRTNFSFSLDPFKRIGSKTLSWEYAAGLKKEENLCFLDVDTLVLKDISHFFTENNFDLIFTDKDEQYPVNTGVMLVRNSVNTIDFFKLWREKTFFVMNDRFLFHQANDPSLPYGAADQMSWYQLLDYQKDKKDYQIKINEGNLSIKALPCAVLNETNSREITPQTHIVHYKGGWQPILLEGANFTKNRPKKKSWQMYIFYLKNYLEMIEYVNCSVTEKIDKKFFKIKFPFYLNKNLDENKLLYQIFCLKNWLKSICFKFLKLPKKVLIFGKIIVDFAMIKNLLKFKYKKSLMRVDVINFFLANFSQYKSTNYLEIGVRRGETIVQVKAGRKVGVDPFLQLDKIDKRFKENLETQTNIDFIEKNSNEFFKENKEFFDVIFIDGLHLYEQSIQDILNSLNFLHDNGVIIVHDCNPQTEKSAARNRPSSFYDVWNGDVWKVIYDLRTNCPELNCFVLDADFGLGIIMKKKNSDRFLPNFKAEYLELPYSFLADKRKEILSLSDRKYFKNFWQEHRQLSEKKKSLITGIVAINDFEPFDYVLYQESIRSTFNLVDHLIIVYGGSIRHDDKTPILDYLKSIESEKISLKYFPWPVDFNWTQFALSYAFGRSFINSRFGVFFTCDEIFPKTFRFVRFILRFIPWFIDYLSFDRLFMVDKENGTRYTRKEIVFRNRPHISFGLISCHERPETNFRDFGRLIDIRRWRNKEEFVKINRGIADWQRQKMERIGVLLSGTRDLRWYKKLFLPWYFINTHALFVPLNLAKVAAIRSYSGYLTLPEGHRFLPKSEEEIFADFKSKIQKQREKKKVQISQKEKNILAKYKLFDEVN